MRIKIIIEDDNGKVLVEKSNEITKDQIRRISNGEPDTTVECSDVFIETCIIASYLIN